MGKKKKRKKRQSNYKYIPPKIEYVYNSIFDLEIKKSMIKNAGLGVYAKENIKSKTLLGNYIGKKKTNDYFSIGTYSIQLNSKYFIEAIDYPRSVFAMINDSRFSNFDYNCEFLVTDNSVEIWSIKFIKEGDELFIDYGDDYWVNR